VRRDERVATDDRGAAAVASQAQAGRAAGAGVSETCRSCGAPITWARTTSGKPIPLDPEPVDRGNLEVEDGVARPVLIEAGKLRYVTHFATCPNAPQHRNRGRG
jgi:hypothetical protein